MEGHEALEILGFEVEIFALDSNYGFSILFSSSSEAWAYFR